MTPWHGTARLGGQNDVSKVGEHGQVYLASVSLDGTAGVLKRHDYR
jgi:hypothetical protein